MNQLQLNQWKEFSVKSVAVLAITEARKSKLKVNVLQFFDEIDAQGSIEEIERWEDVMGVFYDLFEEFHVDCDKEKYTSFQNQLQVVIRAGVDVVTEGWGVVGWFTAGDIKRMFNGDVPSYVTTRFTSNAFDRDDNVLDF